LYPAMYSTTARLAPARVGQALVSMNSPLSEEKKLSASALSQHWPAAVGTRQPYADDPRWARRVANAVLILRVLMLQCRRVTDESLERPDSFLA
jgi:hypothetical protein